ncbi:methyltransferase family protein [Thermoplasmatota archaeon]
MSIIPAFEIGLWNAWIFMVIFIIQMFVIMFVDKKIWKRSHVPIEAKRNRFEKQVGIFANFFWLIAMIYSIFLPLKLNSSLFYYGFIVFVIGHIILIRATYDFITTKPNNIIKTGVYKISRHPMYLSTFIITLSVSIASFSWLFFVLSILMMFFFHKEALIEERFCLEIFSEEYKNYIQHTSRWIGLPKSGKK